MPVAPELVASPGKRFVGALIDGLIFLVVGLPAAAAGAEGFAFATTWVALVAAYEIGLTATRGQTLGKALVGTRVLDQGGERLPSWPQATVRWLLPALPTLVGLFAVSQAVDMLGLVWTVLVYLPVFGPPLHQGWHDRTAGTIVSDLTRVTA